MEKQSFIALVKRYYPWICSMEKAAFRIHDDVNQKYDHVLPYGFHLKMTVSYVSRYGYLVAETEADILILYVSKVTEEINPKVPSEPTIKCMSISYGSV